jgi:hypothetical protein
MQCCMYVAETHNISLFIYFDSELGVDSDREEDQETKDEAIESKRKKIRQLRMRIVSFQFGVYIGL